MKNKKELGQNWLKNRAILEEIADYAAGDIIDGEKLGLCAEIGPGLGFLTTSLLRRFERVIAVEFDRDLAEKLPKSFPGTGLEVVNADFLNVELGAELGEYVIAGNIPYYITSPIIRKILTAENLPKRAVLLVQKEVAERIVAKGGKRSFLSLFVENYAEAELGVMVPREEFTPPPKVDSQVVVLEIRKEPVVSEKVLELAKIGFSNPRKKLVANLAAGLKLEKASLSGLLEKVGAGKDARPADLTLLQWGKLYDKIKI